MRGAALGALLGLLLSLPALGATAGLPGQVAPFVVMDERDVKAALKLAKVGRGDRLIDLGSGDGLLLWIVPAQLGGAWCTARGERFQFEQSYQEVRLRKVPPSLGIGASWEGRLRGSKLISDGTEGRLLGHLEGAKLILQASGAASVKATRC